MTRNITLRMDEKLLKEIKHVAVEEDLSVSAWITRLARQSTRISDMKSQKSLRSRQWKKPASMGEKHTAVMSSMNADIFIDTNILVYAHDRSEAKKHEIAKVLISEIWNNRNSAAISIQVLQEFFTTMIRNGGDPGVFRNIAENYMQWQVIEITCAVLK